MKFRAVLVGLPSKTPGEAPRVTFSNVEDACIEWGRSIIGGLTEEEQKVARVEVFRSEEVLCRVVVAAPVTADKIEVVVRCG